MRRCWQFAFAGIVLFGGSPAQAQTAPATKTFTNPEHHFSVALVKLNF